MLPLVAWLGEEDSNPRSLIQSQASYHWTIPQRRPDCTINGLVVQVYRQPGQWWFYQADWQHGYSMRLDFLIERH